MISRVGDAMPGGGCVNVSPWGNESAGCIEPKLQPTEVNGVNTKPEQNGEKAEKFRLEATHPNEAPCDAPSSICL